MVSTSPPRACGIATFSSDLTAAMRAADPSVRIAWAAINEAQSLHPYGPQVRWRIEQGDPATYQRVAADLNQADVDIVSVQHEFGLYGIWRDEFEDHLAPFLETLRKPLVATLHTVLPEPSPSIRQAVQRLARRSAAVVVMAERARGLLEVEYGVEPAKIHVVQHGVPLIEPKGRRRIKQQLGLRERSIVSTFGLVDPRKGLEFMVRALKDIVPTHPEVLYLIVGRTHPELVRRDGEAYRNELTAVVQASGLDDHVAFVDEYLSQRDIIDYLLLSDVYVTPYLDANQITSGTLSYALAAGKAIVSTRYLHAIEALSDGRGLLVGFRDEHALAEAVLRILDDDELKQALERAAYEYGRKMAWPTVAQEILRLYRVVASQPVPAA